MSFKEEINTAVIRREEGNITRALHDLNQIRGKAVGRGEYGTACDALVQIIVCHQHIYEQSEDKARLNVMLQLANEGIRDASAHPKARDRVRTFVYRLAVAYFLRANYSAASIYFERAFKGLASNDPSFPEFAGYLGAARVLAGQKDGEKFLKMALDVLMKNRKKVVKDGAITYVYKTYPEWHFKIIEAGLFLKLAQVFHYQGKYQEYLATMEMAKLLVIELEKKFHKKQRKIQYERLKKRLER